MKEPYGQLSVQAWPAAPKLAIGCTEATKCIKYYGVRLRKP